MPRSDCQERAADLAEPFRDLGFMLSCYDAYSGPPPVGGAVCDAERPQEGGGE